MRSTNSNRTNRARSVNMGAYFRPRCRKIGVVMLLVACVFLALWVRGQTSFDSVIVSGRGSYTTFQFSNLVMGGHGVLFMHCRNVDPKTAPRAGRSSSPNESTPEKIQELGSGRDAFINSVYGKTYGWWQRRFCGVMIGGANSLWQVWVSYWSIVILLTLLSAWLLLSKPQATTSVARESEHA